MNTVSIVIFALSIFFAVWFTAVVVLRAAAHQAVKAASFVIMSAAWTGIILHLCGIY